MALDRLGIAGNDQNLCPEREKFLSDRKPDPLSSTGDQGFLPLQAPMAHRKEFSTLSGKKAKEVRTDFRGLGWANSGIASFRASNYTRSWISASRKQR